VKKFSKYFFIIITFCFFGEFIKLNFALDTYFVFSSTSKAVVTQFFSCGRFITALAAGISIGLLNLSDNTIYILSYILAVICTIISLYRLYNLIRKDIDKNILSMILSILIIINIFSFELFIYIEKGIMMLSVLMCILAVEQVDKLLQKNKFKHFILSIFYILIATCSYQGTVGIFVAISLIYIIKYSNTIKEFLINNVKVALIYGIPAVINFVMILFASNNSRVEGNILIFESIKKIIDGTKTLFENTYNLFPKNLFSIYILGIILFVIYKAVTSKEKIKTRLLKVFGAIYIFIGTLAVTLAPQILQNTDCIWLVARSSYPIASIIGILLIYLFNQFHIKKLEENILIIICVFFMIVQLIYFKSFAIDGYTVNYRDKQETIEIIKQIEMYEKETRNEITKLAIYNDKIVTYCYPDTKSSGDINLRALSIEWSAKSIINYYLGRNLKIIDSNEKIQQNFSKEDWKEYNEQQIILENDTIHLCLY